MASLVSAVQARRMSIKLENNGRVDGRKDQAVFHVGRLEYLRRELENFIGVRKNPPCLGVPVKANPLDSLI